jgi:hypothetical protein
MADFSQAELDALNAAIASGERVVQYQDRKVEYPNLDDMLKLRDMIRNDLGLNAAKITRKYASTSKGM